MAASGVTPPELTVHELVSRYAGFYPAPRDVDETIDLVGLSDKQHERAGRLSGGQQRRLDVALALAGNPELIFLDEPTTGFDPAARRAAWSMIDNLRTLGKAVILTTHYMEEAEALADRLAVMVAGLPLLYLFIFATVFGDEVGVIPGQPGEITVSTYMTASVIVIGVVSAAFQNLTINLIQDRENGVLKRLRSTPVPTSVFLAGQLVNALAASLLMAVGVAALGIGIYSVPFPGQRTPAAVLAVVLGTLACASAAFPFTRLVRKGTAASAMGIAATLTLFFLSGNFFVGAEMPRAMDFVANLFPVRHFLVAMTTAFNPNSEGAGFEWQHLGVLAAWAIGGAIAGVQLFRWTPTSDR